MTITDTARTATATATGFGSLMTTQGREARPFKVRLTATVSIVVALHLIGFGLLATESAHR